MPTRQLRSPRLDGELRVDERIRSDAADDFGHLVHRMPEAVLLPASEQDVAVTLRWAADRGVRFAPQGRRHSVFGRSQAGDGVVADMTRLRAVDDLSNDRVAVDAGATWRQVMAATLPRGRTVPALPDYLDMSVGGTLAVGGIGAMISRRGAATDNVVELRVLTGRGEVLTCSPERDIELFDAVRAGLGQVGVTIRATMRLIPAPLQVGHSRLFYPDLSTMLADQRRLAVDDRFDAVQAAVIPTPTGWTFRLDAVHELVHGGS